MLRALRDTDGGAVAVEDAALLEAAAPGGARGRGGRLSRRAAPRWRRSSGWSGRGQVDRGETIVVFNTGAGWLYREAEDLRAEG